MFTEEQRQKAKAFIERHTFILQNSVVEEGLRKEFFSIDDIHHFPDSESEIFQWFAVEEWLMNRLLEHGECILDSHGCYWWGRQTYGQALWLDDVIIRLANRLPPVQDEKDDE